MLQEAFTCTKLLIGLAHGIGISICIVCQEEVIHLPSQKRKTFPLKNNALKKEGDLIRVFLFLPTNETNPACKHSTLTRLGMEIKFLCSAGEKKQKKKKTRRHVDVMNFKDAHHTCAAGCIEKLVFSRQRRRYFRTCD